MRARSLKPGFFKNEDLAELPFEARLLFAGLWGFSDREGRFEWRPKKIEAEIFPYDKVSIEKLLSLLCDKKFVERYVVDGHAYGRLPTFLEHQRPHPNEAKSKIPNKPDDIASDIPLRGDAVEKTDNVSLTPSSLTPSSLTPDSSLGDFVTLLGQPHEIVFLFNETVKYIPRVTKTRSRDDKIRTRLKEHRERDWWKTVFEKADNILIPSKKQGQKDWFPTFDWIIDNDKNAVKVFEGNYDNSQRPKTLREMGFGGEEMWLRKQEEIDAEAGQEKISHGNGKNESEPSGNESNRGGGSSTG